MGNNGKMTEEERLKQLELLKTSYQMYENSKSETIKRRKESLDKNGNPMYTDESTKDTIDLMETMQQDIKEQYLQLGGDEKELIALKPKGRKKNIDRKAIVEAMKKTEDITPAKGKVKPKKKKGDFSVYDPNKIVEAEPMETVEEPLNEDETEEVIEETFTKQKDFTPFENTGTETVVETTPQLDFTYKPKSNTNIQYDVIPLPSKGECYPDGRDKITVAYLTAYDENLILSPNLYRDGTFLDHILSNKILDDVDPDDLVKGDRDAILLWLRASGYGNEYPIKVTDNETKEEFETIIDLSTIKFKEFNLKGDENGYFDTILPLSGDLIKYRFLPNRETKKLIEMKKKDDKDIYTTRIKENAKEIINAADYLEESISKENKIKIQRVTKELEELVLNNIEEGDFLEFGRDLTNKLALCITSVNGITDRAFINNYALNMNVRDAAFLRKQITDNEPGLNYNIKVEKPESLGGGVTETFLRLDQFIFINVVQ